MPHTPHPPPSLQGTVGSVGATSFSLSFDLIMSCVSVQVLSVIKYKADFSTTLVETS